MQQLAQSFTVPFTSLSIPDVGQIDQWLHFAFDIKVPATADQSPAIDLSEQSPRSATAAQAMRALYLARYLLEAARLPVFDEPRLLGVHPDATKPDAWIITAALARIDHVSVSCYRIALNESIHIIHWMARKAPDNASRKKLFDGIETRVIRPIGRLLSGGKSTLPVLRTAHSLLIPFAHLGAGVYQLGWGSQARRIDRSTTGADSAIGSKLSRNKACTASLLRMAGLPAPTHGLAQTTEKALGVARVIGWPVVIKPVDGERGEGVTVGVSDEAHLQKAFDHAHRASATHTIVVEKEVSGVCHRLFIANKKLLYAVKRWPKSVHGDGRHTVRELIGIANHEEANKPPWLRSEAFPDDSLAEDAVRSAGFHMHEVPRQGERVPLRNIESTLWGGFDEDVTHAIHPDNLDIALRAAALFGLSVAGIDIITTDIGVPWHQSRAIINEVNFAPLLGGGDISRSHIPTFLKELIRGEGRIPIEVIVGDRMAMSLALDRQRAFARENVRCFVSSHETTFMPSGAEMHLPLSGLHGRTRALLLNNQVDALVLVVQTDEFLRTGLPVDRIDQLTSTIDGEATSSLSSDLPPINDIRDLLTLLRRHFRTNSADRSGVPTE